MDRQTLYPYEVPAETDFLTMHRFAYEGLGLMAMDILGTGTLVSGLACIPTSPASLQVKIQPGRIYSKQDLEDTVWGQVGGVGGLAVDTNVDHQIIKQGLYRDTTTLATMPAPGTAGQSINYLIEAAFSEVDDTPVSLPFVSSTSPYPPVAPSTLNTARRNKVVITVKAGTPATTGTQTTPAVDSGNVGLWVVTVANGQSTITAGNISAYASAPFITETLTQKISQTTGDGRYLRPGVNARTKLAANTNFYVRSDGSNANSGLVNSAAGAWLTVQYAVDFIRTNYDLAGFTATINIGAGSFGGVTARGPFLGGGGTGVYGSSTPSVILLGNGAGSTILTDCQVTDGAFIQFQNMSLRGTSRALQVFNSGQASINTVTFDSTPGTFHLEVYATGILTINGPVTFAGSAQAWLSCGANAVTICLSQTLTFTGTPAWSNAGIFLLGGFANFASCTVVGSATGQRYSSTYNGLLNLQGTVPPGSASGTTSNGGQVIP